MRGCGADLFCHRFQNPATGEPLGDIPIASEDVIDKAVAAAEEAQVRWAKVSARKRSAIVRRFATLMDQNKKRLAEVRPLLPTNQS